jgi:hypothetical protein
VRDSACGAVSRRLPPRGGQQANGEIGARSAQRQRGQSEIQPAGDRDLIPQLVEGKIGLKFGGVRRH